MERIPSERERFEQAYLMMARVARYRPEAPGNGFGDVTLSKEQIADVLRLKMEAASYAKQFISGAEMSYFVGVPNYETNRALVFVIEAARCLCGVQDDVAAKLLKMALAEIKPVKRKR